MELILLLLILFELKHFLADFPLQNQYMLGKSKEVGWQLPLLSHCVIHGIGTFVITYWFGIVNAIAFSTFDISTHFVMDRFKADKQYLGRWLPNNKYYFWALGLDQLVHHLVNFIIVYFVIKYNV